MATLFEKVSIGNLKLKNRLVVPPMGFMTDIDGGVSERQRAYITERAKGGFGLIYPNCCVVSDRFEDPASAGANTLKNKEQGKRLSYAVDEVHTFGAKMCLQLSMGLGRVDSSNPFKPSKSSSPTPNHWYPNLICEPYTVDEIHWLVDRFGYTAYLAMNAGVDVVELHAYGGYVIDQFISKQWNSRTDEYGGSLDNRLRLVFELRESIWKYCGKDFPVAMKYTPDHGYKGGRTLEDEGIEIAKRLDDGGFCYLHLDYGCYECWYNAVTTEYQKDGLQLFLAKTLKDAGIKTPLLVQGKLDDPELAESTVALGAADMIALGHQSLADPAWPNKVKKEQMDDIIPCIGCNECIYRAMTNKSNLCAVNPLTGMELDNRLRPVAKKYHILVVGGGPGGMTSAITAKKQGHEVELWEKSDRLGGNLRAAGAPPFKVNTKRYLEYLERQVHKNGVMVRLRKEATVENVAQFNPDAVLLAAGAIPILPPIPGSKESTVIEATELLIKGTVTGQKVIILGGGLVGCETAIMLKQQGKDVTVVELLDSLLLTAKISPNNSAWLQDTIGGSGITIKTGTKLTKINPKTVTVESKNGTEELPYDTLVLAVGFTADQCLADALLAKFDNVFVIGDQNKPGKVIDAVHQGYNSIRLLDELMETI
jgi:2-enoate reductase